MYLLISQGLVTWYLRNAAFWLTYRLVFPIVRGLVCLSSSLQPGVGAQPDVLPTSYLWGRPFSP